LLGLARWSAGDWPGAYAAYQDALSVEPRTLGRGHLYCQWGLLEIERRELEAALEKIATGYSLIVRAEPSGRDLAHGLIARSVCYWHHGRYYEAEADCRRALVDHIHPKRDARLHFSAVQNLALCYVYGTGGVERIVRALDALGEAEAALRRCRLALRNSKQGAYLLWTRGMVLRMIGAVERSESLYQSARQVFERIGAMTEWIELSLDLGDIYLDHGQWGRLRSLVGEMLQVTRDPETVVALTLFLGSLDRRQLDDEVLRRVYRTIHGHRRKVPVVPTPVDELEGPIGF
jgi:tetratricopeptide (TPR) repeat protein